jgi:hypothetical protein
VASRLMGRAIELQSLCVTIQAGLLFVAVYQLAGGIHA